LEVWILDAYPDEIDLREYIEVLWRWRFFIMGITLAAALTALLVSVFVLQPTYQASVQITVPQTPVPAEVIKSPHFMNLVIEGLDLGDRYDAFSLSRAVSLETSKSSAALTTITVECGSRELSARLANTIAAEFLDFVKDQHEETISSSVDYYVEERDTTQALLVSVREEIAALKQTTNLAALQSEVNRLAGQVTSHLNRQVEAKLRERELAKGIEEIEKALETTPPTLPGPPDWSGRETVVPNQVYQSLSESLTFKRVELSETLIRLEEISSALPSLKADYEAKYAILLDYQNQIDLLETQERDLTGQIASFTDSINKITATMPQMNVVSPAVEPVDPVKPQKLLNTVVAAVLGGFVSVLAVFAIEYWRSPRKSTTMAQPG
jgi:capsular polysaccharide biosynthesis protein